MHTFFINTSKKSLSSYEVLFDISYETRSLVSMDCPIADWYDASKGYSTCVKKMSDMIDGYVELNNAYNLLIYIDASEYKEYSSIERDAFHDMERDAYLKAMHILYTHIISKTIVEELSDSGRKPHEVLIMFGEEKKFADFKVISGDPNNQVTMAKLFELMGLPDEKTTESIAKKIVKSNNCQKVEMFSAQIAEACSVEIVNGLRTKYESDLQLWCDEIITETDISKANAALFNRIHELYKVESERGGIELVSCPYDHYACKVNKAALALSELNISLHLLACLENSSIYESNNDKETSEEHLIPFRAYTIDEVAPAFARKKSIYLNIFSKIESLEKSYTELQVAPELSAFDHKKFGLDKFGFELTDLVINNVDHTKEHDEKPAAESEAFPVNTSKEVEVVKKAGHSLLTLDGRPLFDYNYDSGSDKMLKKNTSPEEYISRALEVRKHHLNYLNKVRMHISNTLSNYAGKSKENKAALLKVGEGRYSTPEKETNPVESVADVSKQAFETTLNKYMDFCAGRTVEITDIEEQCNWFVTRVTQITESLNKLKMIGCGLLALLVFLYVPFIVIQFDHITANIGTFAVATGSFIAPFLVLFAIFTAAIIAQRKEYLKAWMEFKAKSDQALAENKTAVQKYEQLLSIVIPSLRWVYEYKLMVEYCVMCCDVADAKVGHHKNKIGNRISAIRNILSDLEYPESDTSAKSIVEPSGTEAIDFNAAFCSGNMNKAFYSIVNKSFFTNND